MIAADNSSVPFAATTLALSPLTKLSGKSDGPPRPMLPVPWIRLSTLVKVSYARGEPEASRPLMTPPCIMSVPPPLSVTRGPLVCRVPPYREIVPVLMTLPAANRCVPVSASSVPATVVPAASLLTMNWPEVMSRSAPASTTRLSTKLRSCFVTTTTAPAPIRTSLVSTGTWPLLQLAAMPKWPPAGPVQVARARSVSEVTTVSANL